MRGMTWRRSRLAAALLAGLALVAGCSMATKLPDDDPRTVKANRAMAMFQERCKTAGEKIYRTVFNVEGIFVMKLRPPDSFDSKDAIDPYGSDVTGEGYLGTFLKGSFPRGENYRPEWPPRTGYNFVDAIDPKDGKRYRYSGRIEEPWQTDKSYSKGYVRFALARHLSDMAPPRYGVTYDDISTTTERDHWIAGSSLRVIDLQTKEVVAERIGYMVDPGQGNALGGRSPWLVAASYACPSFHRFPNPAVKNPAYIEQLRQTQDFVEKVLHPIKETR